MTTIGIIYKKEDPIIAGTAQKVTAELKRAGYKIDLTGARFVITFGGDGTILRAARLLAKKGTPILGIHLGGVGFLTEIELEQLNSALEKIAAKKYRIDERSMLEVSVAGKTLLALNDVVIAKSGISRVIKFDLEGVANYTADGLIFSSATGSTAYNLAVGGPLLDPASKSIIISAICPHTLSNRSLVTEGPAAFILRRGDDVIMTADGQQVIPIKLGQKVVVRQSRLKTRFIRLHRQNFFEKVRNTFGFGAGN